MSIRPSLYSPQDFAVSMHAGLRAKLASALQHRGTQNYVGIYRLSLIDI